MRDWFRQRGLVRPREGRVLGGVCRGIANKLGSRVWVVRLLAVLSILLPGPQVIAYIALWILMPSE